MLGDILKNKQLNYINSLNRAAGNVTFPLQVIALAGTLVILRYDISKPNVVYRFFGYVHNRGASYSYSFHGYRK